MWSLAILWPVWKREKRLKPSYLIEIPGFSHQVGRGGRLREQMGFWREWSLVVSQPGFPRVPTLISFWEGERENPILHLSGGPFPSCWHSRRVSPVILVTNSNGYPLFKSPRAVSVPHLLRSSTGEIWTWHELKLNSFNYPNPLPEYASPPLVSISRIFATTFGLFIPHT